MTFRKKILFGHVGHSRLAPRKNSFKYRAFFFSLPLLSIKQKESKFFSINKLNFFSLWFKDYGDQTAESPINWVQKILSQHGLENIKGEIILQTLPRIVGYSFNPISFWFCYDQDKILKAIICEVRNTFGERHSYLLTQPDNGAISDKACFVANKAFHVSPFFSVDGTYHFRFAISPKSCNITINYLVNNQIKLKTFISGTYQEWNDWNLIRAAIVYPLLTINIIIQIHWQALKLWSKRVRYIKKPPPPNKAVSR